VIVIPPHSDLVGILTLIGGGMAHFGDGIVGIHGITLHIE
jgi:hypothetical protein